MADLFDVISDPTRRNLLHVLLQRYLDDDPALVEISVGEIVELLALTQPTVSKHLRVLRDHGLVTVREDGQHRFYRLDSTPLAEIEDWLLPFLEAGLREVDFDSANAEGSAVFAAWSGADIGETIGRRVAEGTHGARSAIHGAAEQVTKRSRRPMRRRPFRR